MSTELTQETAGQVERKASKRWQLSTTVDLYSCDHFIEPNHRLGNILETPLAELARIEKQRAFGQDKSAALPRQCKECKWLFTCHGECPKNRGMMIRKIKPS